MSNEHLRFPVGQFEKPDTITSDHLTQWIDDIESLPFQVEDLIEGKPLSDLNKRYRPDGWTAAQVIHHCADSHINSIIRFKLAITEDVPTIRPYYEDRWAELADYEKLTVEDSITFLKNLHYRWVILLRSLTPYQLKREFIHPDNDHRTTVAENIGIYAWHCRHHLEHVRIALGA